MTGPPHLNRVDLGAFRLNIHGLQLAVGFFIADAVVTEDEAEFRAVALAEDADKVPVIHLGALKWIMLVLI